MTRLILSHGGVDMSDDDATFSTLRRACDRAAEAADPIDAVVAGLAVLENDPAFNAGYGSVLTADGTVEVDAAIVNARSRQYGAVGAVPGLRQPAAVAAEVLRSDGPVLLAGNGAMQFARSHGHHDEDLTTDEQRRALESMRAGTLASMFTGREAAPSTETVGCIVVDGNSATAGSSTGGVLGKLPGRIGDSAILGAGVWADEHSAVVCSGAGEAMISLGLARRVGERIAAGEDVQDAVRWAVRTAAEELRAVSAVLAVDIDSGAVGAAHCGASFPVIAQRDGAPRIVAAERLAGPA